MYSLVKALEQYVAFERELQRLYAERSLSDDLDKLRLSMKNLLGDFDEAELCAEPLTAEKVKVRDVDRRRANE